MNTATTFEAAFTRAYDAHAASLGRYLDRLCGDADLADDLTQEAFVRLYERGSMPDNTRTWLVVVATNLLRDERRRRARRGRLLHAREASDLMGDAGAAPDAAVMQGESGGIVRRALARLPERDARLLLLREEGLTYGELARALSIHEASVGTLLARARAAFRAALGR